MACALYASQKLLHRSHSVWQLALTHKTQLYLSPVQCLSHVTCVRHQSTEKRQQNAKPSGGQGSSGGEIDVARKSAYEGLSAGQKVKEAGKDVTYFAATIAAIGVLGLMAYYIGRELLSGASPNGIYNRAFKRCKNDPEIQVAMGSPLKGYGEMSSRGRRRHVSHHEFINEADGKKHMRMKFYIESPEKKATVHVEMAENDSKKYDYRYLFVQFDEFPYRTIVLEDNR